MMILKAQGYARGWMVKNTKERGFPTRCMVRGYLLGWMESNTKGIIYYLIFSSFKEDKFDGYGQFNWPNGVCYKGYWANGEMNGTGILITDK